MSQDYFKSPRIKRVNFFSARNESVPPMRWSVRAESGNVQVRGVIPVYTAKQRESDTYLEWGSLWEYLLGKYLPPPLSPGGCGTTTGVCSVHQFSSGSCSTSFSNTPCYSTLIQKIRVLKFNLIFHSMLCYFLVRVFILTGFVEGTVKKRYAARY